MKRPFMLWAAVFSILAAGPVALALDELSGPMKQILDHRSDNFSSIRKNPRGDGDEIVYSSAIILPGADKCYIAPTAKPYYSDECSVLETKNHAAVMARYKKMVKALREASPASWMVWTKQSIKPPGESTSLGPDRTHPAASINWALEGMNMDWYDLSVTFYAEGYPADGEK